MLDLEKIFIKGSDDSRRFNSRVNYTLSILHEHMLNLLKSKASNFSNGVDGEFFKSIANQISLCKDIYACTVAEDQQVLLTAKVVERNSKPNVTDKYIVYEAINIALLLESVLTADEPSVKSILNSLIVSVILDSYHTKDELYNILRDNYDYIVVFKLKSKGSHNYLSALNDLYTSESVDSLLTGKDFTFLTVTSNGPFPHLTVESNDRRIHLIHNRTDAYMQKNIQSSIVWAPFEQVEKTSLRLYIPIFDYITPFTSVITSSLNPIGFIIQAYTKLAFLVSDNDFGMFDPDKDYGFDVTLLEGIAMTLTIYQSNDITTDLIKVICNQSSNNRLKKRLSAVLERRNFCLTQQKEN